MSLRIKNSHVFSSTSVPVVFVPLTPLTICTCACLQSLQVAQKEAQIRLLEGQLRQTDMIGSSHNHMILDALREKAEYIPELQALIHNVQQGEDCVCVCVCETLVFHVLASDVKHY